MSGGFFSVVDICLFRPLADLHVEESTTMTVDENEKETRF